MSDRRLTRIATDPTGKITRSNQKPEFVSTTDSKHDLPVAENWLGRQFEVAAPNQAWVSDITYIRTRMEWLYLALLAQQGTRCSMSRKGNCWDTVMERFFLNPRMERVWPRHYATR